MICPEPVQLQLFVIESDCVTHQVYFFASSISSRDIVPTIPRTQLLRGPLRLRFPLFLVHIAVCLVDAASLLK